jgi:hypothetical protein
MSKKKDKDAEHTAKDNSKKALRFAHPFFTNTPPKERTPTHKGNKKMTDYVATQLLPIPDPKRDPPTMELSEIIGTDGAAEVTTAKQLVFHSFGDSGNTSTDIQEVIAGVMAKDYNPDDPAGSPSFLLHLGDVIYYANTDVGYQSQFYTPYKEYPGKIIAIPGNHDGELFKYDGTSTGQKVTLGAFQDNFCQPKTGVPADAGTIYREMVSQPGVYWYLDTPFVDIIGLYSNIGEGPGYISGPKPGQAQKKWLTEILTELAEERNKGPRKALLIAVHHPPYSNGGHEASTDMLKDIDDSCTTAGIMPDAVLAGHSHNYQRFTRYTTFKGKNMQIPYYVVGTGGRKPSSVKAATGARVDDYSFDSSLSSYGYLTVVASATELTFAFTEVKEDGTSSPFDKKITVNLADNTIS